MPVTIGCRRYPSVHSSVQGNHLPMFEFCGRILAHAILEGVLVDLSFAPFFLRHIMRQPNTIDSLQTLDPLLYKNLIFVRDYEGDVDDLALTFSVEVEHFGVTRTYELGILAYSHQAHIYSLSHPLPQQQRRMGVRLPSRTKQS
jgi:hypothetical protein